LLRRPEKSRHEATTLSMTETFWCIATVSGGALKIRPSALPTSIGELHQPSAQARTPRVAHCSA
jgi:hypothetical protein